MDGFGILQKPYDGIMTISRNDIDIKFPNSRTPPGIYGNTNDNLAYNLSGKIKLSVFNNNKTFENVTVQNDYRRTIINLEPILLIVLFTMFFIDMIISFILRAGNIPRFLRTNHFKIFNILPFILIYTLISIDGQTTENNTIYGTHLAYVSTSDKETNRISSLALNALARKLTTRTSIEPKESVEIDINKDEIYIFPFIYWPITDKEANLTDDSISKIKLYLKRGGMILFDTRDNTKITEFNIKQNLRHKNLRYILKYLDLPPLVPIPQGHTLSKSFYLLKSFPGKWIGNNIWIENTSIDNKDGVSSVIIGSNDWSSAWALNQNDDPLFPVVPGGETQREYSFRFGINLVMYAMTGNYKSDQIHAKSILQRLGLVSSEEETK